MAGSLVVKYQTMMLVMNTESNALKNMFSSEFLEKSKEVSELWFKCDDYMTVIVHMWLL